MNDLVKRLWEKDATLWSNKKQIQTSIINRLGWLDSPKFLRQQLTELNDFAKEVHDRNFTQVVLLGMGGSSLCPYMFSSIFGSAPGFPNLLVLDSTDPDTIRQVQSRINIAQTLFIVASKSGGTIEPNCLFKYFYALVAEAKSNPGEDFIAITDPGSSLIKLAQDHHFARTFINPPDIGGRYSALSYFGLVPAASIGMNLTALKDSLLDMAKACKKHSKTTNPALELADFMANNVKNGKNKLTFLMDACLTPFGLWLEQLLAESTGKNGTGIIPIAGEQLGDIDDYGQDRCFVSIALECHEEKSRLDLISHLKATNVPVTEFTFHDPYQLAGEFLRWEIATALCGHFLRINPFDEPNVTESKQNTNEILSYFTTYGKMPQELTGQDKDWNWQYSPNLAKQLGSDQINNLESGLKELFASITNNGYLGILMYLPYQEKLEERAQQIRSLVRHKLKCATVFGFGPRYLHSSGQEHKGGPDNGVFLILTRDSKDGLDIPTEGFNFGQLQFAQALGDFKSLADKGRSVIHLNLGLNYQESLSQLSELIAHALC